LPAAETVAARQRRPTGEGRGGLLPAAEIGSAHHAFLEGVALGETGSAARLREEAARLRREGRLTEAQAGCLDFKALAAFWRSEVGLQLLGRREQVRREVAFTARFSPSELEELRGRGAGTGEDGEEFVIVQGVMDLAVVTPEEIWVLDFKTDHFAEEELEAKVCDYRPQIMLYARAIARIYGQPVTRRWLHFFAAGRTVELG
jgi:ATP-dependent helicase/nuclease subunit A